MTVSSTTNRVSFTGNGSTTAFSFPYYFQSTGDLVVILKVISTGAETVQTITTHYTVSGTQVDNVYPNGGTITTVTAPSALQELIIYRDPALTQSVDLVENSALSAETLEQAFDKRTIIEQRLDDRMDRAVRQREGYTGSLDPRLPALDVTEGVLQINAAGTGFQWATFDTGPLEAHLTDTTDAHDASAISNVPSGNLASTDVQAALNELQTDIDTGATNLANHLADASDAHDASAISNVPSGNLAATDVQSALDELQTDIDGRQAGPLTGDVTTSGTAATIANDAVTNAKLANMATQTFKGRTTAGTGDPEDLTATQATAILNTFTSTDKGLAPASGGGTTNFLRADGTWATPADTDTGITQLTGDVTAGPGNGSQAATIPNDTVTYAKMQNVSAASKLLGRGDSGSGDPQEITLGTGLTMTGTTLDASGGSGITSLTGDVTGTGPGATATTIANDSVTFAKMQNIATDSLIGRDTAGSGDPENILLNATLSMDGSGNLQREALTGDVTAPAGSNTTTLATVNSNVGSFTRSSITVNAKGLITAASSGGAIDLTADVTGALPIGNGGSGQTTANAALNAFLPSQASNSGKFLQTDGTNTSWQTASGGSVTDYAFYGSFTASAVTTNSGTYALPTTSTSVALTSVLNKNMGTVSVYNSGGTNYFGITWTPPATGIYAVSYSGFVQPDTAGAYGIAAIRTSLSATYLDETFYRAYTNDAAGFYQLNGLFEITSLASTDIYLHFKRFSSGTVNLYGSGLLSNNDNKIRLYKIN